MTLIYPITSNAAHPAHLSPAYRSSIKRAPSKPLIQMRHTLSELTGPVYGHESVRENDHDLTIQHKGEPLGERIIVHGHVLDEDGRGVPNTLLEIWQVVGTVERALQAVSVLVVLVGLAGMLVSLWAIPQFIPQRYPPQIGKTVAV